MSESKRQEDLDLMGKLKPLKDYIIKLYYVGGITLVLIGLGAT